MKKGNLGHKGRNSGCCFKGGHACISVSPLRDLIGNLQEGVAQSIDNQRYAVG